MTFTIPSPLLMLIALVLLIAIAFTKAAGALRFLAAAAIFFFGAWLYWEPIGWTPLILGVVGMLFVLGFFDALRVKK